MPQSPIEARLAVALKEASVPFKEQVSIGPFSVDFLIFSESGQPIFIIECDGADYHDAERDTSRDASITEHTGLKTLRFSGRQINFNLSDCVQNIQHQYASSIEALGISRLGFDSSQRNVVFAPLGPMLVYAPAGSGKTRALIGRIVYLIEKHGFIPSRICALTFTRDAAQEMRTRISQQLSPAVSELINIGTFHSLAGKLKVTDGRNVIEEDRRMAILMAAARHAQLAIPLTELSVLISQKKANLMDLAGYAKQCAANKFAESAAEVASNQKFIQAWRFYEAQLNRNRECDYDDLLLLLAQKAKTDVSWAKRLSSLFDYVLVDEAQDNNRAQDEILNVLTCQHSNFMIVGDDDQSIYGFRGAMPSLLEKKEHQQNMHVCFLDGNYRSHPEIVFTALGFITGSIDRRIKTMHPKRVVSGNAIHWMEQDGPIDEARAIAKRILDLQGEGNNLSDIAILIRSNFQSEVISNELLNAGIAAINHSHDSILKKRAVQVVFSYLNVVRGNRNWKNAMLALRYPNRYLPRELLDRLENCNDVLLEWKAYSSRLIGTNEEWKADRWQEDIDKLNLLSKNIESEPSKIIQEIRREFSLDNVFDQLIDGKVVFSGKPHLDYFESMARSFSTTEELFDYCNALNRTTRGKSPSSRVRIMTIHKSKGLEFPTVFLTEMAKEQFPHPQGDRQEERRLCYVALTRAIDRLILCADKKHPSEFVAEIKECIKQPIELSIENGKRLPKLPHRIGDYAFCRRLMVRFHILGFSTLHGIIVRGADGQIRHISVSDATSWIPWIERTIPGEIIEGTGFKVGQKVRDWLFGKGTIIEYRSDKGFHVDFFVQKLWLSHERAKEFKSV